MATDTAFYILGGLLTATALGVSLLGLRNERLPGRAFAAFLALFLVLVVATAVLAVRNGQEESAARAAEEATAAGQGGGETAQAPSGQQQGGGGTPAPAPKGPGGKLSIAADAAQLAFDKKTLSTKPGKVEVTFTNPAQIAHNFAIEEGGKLLGQTPLITASTATQTFDLAPGSYTFLCTVPGHAQAGMQGTLTVK
jgi:plastocyanin